MNKIQYHVKLSETDQAVVFFQDDGWYFCLVGDGPNGLTYETDDIGPFFTSRSAEYEARLQYEEMQTEEEEWDDLPQPYDSIVDEL